MCNLGNKNVQICVIKVRMLKIVAAGDRADYYRSYSAFMRNGNRWSEIIFDRNHGR